MKDIGKSVTESDKQVLKAVAPLGIILILFVFVGKFGFSQISGVRSRLKEIKKTHSTLTQKLNILSSISGVSSEWANTTAYALPETNPSLQVLSQIRILSSNNNLVLSDIKVSTSGSGSKGLFSVNSTFGVMGTKDSILEFARNLDNIAPITFISKMQISESDGVAQAEINTQTFYAPMPKNIPGVSQAVTDLSESEKEMITQISSLNSPVVGDSFLPIIEGVNPAPFGE